MTGRNTDGFEIEGFVFPMRHESWELPLRATTVQKIRTCEK